MFKGFFIGVLVTLVTLVTLLTVSREVYVEWHDTQKFIQVDGFWVEFNRQTSLKDLVRR